ncbi:MAG: hypothetical protein AAGH41_05370 [Pseudomonadota bacterium]
MLSMTTIALAAASVLSGPNAEGGIPIAAALADKPTPLPVYEISAERSFDVGHKNIPVPDARQRLLVIPVSYRYSGFRGLEAYHGASEVVLGHDAFHAPAQTKRADR